MKKGSFRVTFLWVNQALFQNALAMTQSVYAMKMVLGIQTIHVKIAVLEMDFVAMTTTLKCATLMEVNI